MPAYEYRVTSAPRGGVKAKGVRTPEARFAFALEAEMNRMAVEGWEYVRSDTLPCEERQGWFKGKAVVPRTVLVFRRALPEEPEARPAAPPAYTRPVRPAPVAAPIGTAPIGTAPVHAAPVRGVPVRAAEPAGQGPVTEDPPLMAPPEDPVVAPAVPTLPPVPSPPAAAPQVAAPAASPMALPPLGPAATTIVASPRRAQVPPFRFRDGEAPVPPPIKPLGKASV
jgi:hypothetical protein